VPTNRYGIKIPAQSNPMYVKEQPLTHRERAPVPPPMPMHASGSVTERGSQPLLNADTKSMNAIAGYSGFHSGVRDVFGRGYTNSITDAASLKLPQLTTPKSNPPEFYYRKSVKRGELTTPVRFLRNKSSVSLGDPRRQHWDSQTTADYREWGMPSQEEELSSDEIARLYHHAKRRVPEWRVDQMEADLKARIDQKRRGGAFSLRQGFKFFDRDGSGGLSFGELQHGLALLGLQFSDEEVLALMARNDPDYTNDIDYMRLIEKVQETDQYLQKASPEQGPTKTLGHRLTRPSPMLFKQMQSVLSKMELRTRNAMEPDEVRLLMSKLGMTLTDEEVENLFLRKCVTRRSQVQFVQFYDWYKDYAYSTYL